MVCALGNTGSLKTASSIAEKERYGGGEGGGVEAEGANIKGRYHKLSVMFLISSEWIHLTFSRIQLFYSHINCLSVCSLLFTHAAGLYPCAPV